MSQEERTAQIEAWLDGTLDAEARAAFAASLRDDPVLAAEVALHERLRRVVQEKSAGAFRQQIDGLLGEHRARPAARRFSLSRFSWALAAALLLALAAVWFWFPANPAPEELFAQAFQPPQQFSNRPVRQTTGSLPVTADPAWARLDAAWAANDRDRALDLALEISRMEQDTQSRQAAFYAAGVIALADGKPEAAILHLKNAEGSKLYSEEIVWYTALARVQLALADRRQTDRAIQALEAVKKGSQPPARYLLADQLLESLQRRR